MLADANDWLPVLRGLGATPEELRHILLIAEARGGTFRAALMEAALFSEAELSRALANTLRIEFLDDIPSKEIGGTDEECVAALGRANIVATADLSGFDAGVTTLVAPRDMAISELKRLIGGEEARGRAVALVPSEALRQSLAQRLSGRLTEEATNGLFTLQPHFSARSRFSSNQALIAGLVVVALVALLSWKPLAVFIAAHLLGSAFFLACTLLRATALLGKRPRRRDWSRPDMADLPVYSVLVALHREKEIVPQLIAALERIDWPRDRLEVKLVCEADDSGTIEAIQACQPSASFEIIRVPPSKPRTKPKALRYALTMTSGEFVVLYDAEDRPHPEQLLEAYARFRASGPDVVCLQAPLTVTNGARSMIARMFAFEYAGLFRSILPWLATLRQALPLGGTSNHFRRDALEAVGSWDPHNVTEDADLGVRLFRCGRRAETISLPTLEAAPEHLRVWLPQRTRWLKGWLQTWLVHMRHPAGLLSEIGLPSFLATQILLAGMFFSALLHPVIFLTLPVYIVLPLIGIQLANWQLWLLALGWRSLTKRERAGFGAVVLATPFYWLLISWAAWLALFEFIRHPHRWNKTPHKPG